MQEGKMIQSVAKAMQLLDILAASPAPMGLAEISAETGWPKSTIHGLFATMREYSVVTQDEEGRYMLGVRLFEYGCTLSSAWTVLDIVRPYVQHISYETGERVFLSILDRGEIITLANAENRMGLPPSPETGCRLPVHCTSQGKLFLALAPERERRRLLQQTELRAYTDHTITTQAALQRELEQIRSNGYAVANGEYRTGLRSIAAPVFGKDGAVCCAVGAIGVFRRIESEQFNRTVAVVVDTARKISQKLSS